MRTIRLGLAATAGLVAAAVIGVGPAWSHVEVSADNPTAGATNVTLAFTGEAESTDAGIASERVYLPAGITPQQVTLAKAPAGWTFAMETDGFTVGGTPLPVGADAEFSVVVAKLPAEATQLIFKTVETYSDGQVDRWITEPQAGGAEPPNPAPVLKLAPAAPGSAGSPTPTATSAAPTTTAPPSEAAPAPADQSGSGGAVWWVVAAVVVIAAIAGGFFFARSRRPTP